MTYLSLSAQSSHQLWQRYQEWNEHKVNYSFYREQTKGGRRVRNTLADEHEMCAVEKNKQINLRTIEYVNQNEQNVFETNMNSCYLSEK